MFTILLMQILASVPVPSLHVTETPVQVFVCTYTAPIKRFEIKDFMNALRLRPL